MQFLLVAVLKEPAISGIVLQLYYKIIISSSGHYDCSVRAEAVSSSRGSNNRDTDAHLKATR